MGNGATQYKQLTRVGGLALKHSSQRIICSAENPCGSEGSTGPRKGMFSLSLGNSSSKYFDYTTMRKSEAKRMWVRSFIGKFLLLTLALVAVVMGSACAAFQPTDANGPTANRPQYPIALSDVGPRLEEASVAWYQLSQRYGLPGKTEANLHPYTATLESLPANMAAPIYLPKVGSPTAPTEEDTRESLRRFIVEWQTLLSLIHI